MIGEPQAKAEPRCNRYRNAIGFRRLLLRSLTLTSLSVLPANQLRALRLLLRAKRRSLAIDERDSAKAEHSGADEMSTPGD